jgi:hypothetical protein
LEKEEPRKQGTHENPLIGPHGSWRLEWVVAMGTGKKDSFQKQAKRRIDRA